MKFAAIIEYRNDKDGLNANHPAHRTYLRTVRDKFERQGQNFHRIAYAIEAD